MSVDATRWAWMQQGITQAQKLILLSLADRADEDNRCWPSILRLKEDTCIGNRHTVIDGLKALETKGLINVERTFGSGSVYTLIGVESRENTSAKTGTTTGAKSGTGTGAKSGTLNLPLEPNNEPIILNTRAREASPSPKAGFRRVRKRPAYSARTRQPV